MKKEQKSAIVEQMAANLGRASIAIISEQKGLTAAEADEMRRRLRAIQGELQIAKNTLVRLALKETPFAWLESKLGGPIGLIVCYADPVELAKTLGAFREFGDKFKVRGGVLEGKPLTPEEIATLAALPPREVIFAQLLGLLQAPATRLVRLLNEPGSAIARLIDAIGKKAGAAGETAAAPPPPSA